MNVKCRILQDFSRGKRFGVKSELDRYSFGLVNLPVIFTSLYSEFDTRFRNQLAIHY